MKLYNFLVFIFIIWPNITLSNENNRKSSFSISCNIQTETKQDCRLKFLKRIYISSRFQDNYDPRMKAMLTSASIAAETVSKIKHFEGNSEFQKYLLIHMTKWVNRLDLNLKSIDTDQLTQYTLRVVGTALEEGVDLASEKLTLLSPNKALAVVSKLAPSAIDLAKVMVNEFPKISVAEPQSIQEHSLHKAETFALLNLLLESKVLNFKDADVIALLDTAYGTFFKETFIIDENKLAMDPEVQQVAALTELMKYSEGKLLFQVQASEEKLGKVINSAAEQTALIINKTHTFLKESVQDMAVRQTALISGQRALLSGQNHIIEGLDYLSHRELRREQEEKLIKLNDVGLAEFIKTAKGCDVLSEVGPDGLTHFKPVSLEQRNCAVQKKMVKTAENRIRHLKAEMAINIANQSISTIINLGIIFKDKNLQKIGNDASNVMSAFEKAREAMEAIEKMSKSASLISNISNFMSGAGAITSAIKVFGASGPSIDELILKQLIEIRKAIEELHQDMINEFILVNAKLDDLALELNDSLIAHGRVVNSNLSVLHSQGDQNTEEILDRLDVLSLLNTNLDRHFKKADQTDIVDLSKQFDLSKTPEDLFLAFRNLLARYSALLEEVDPDSITPYQADLGFENIDSIKSYESIFRLSSVQKINPYGRALMLGTLIGLQPDLTEECGTKVFEKILFANIITERFIKYLESDVDYNGEKVLKVDLALSNQNQTDIDSFLSTLNRILETMYSLQSKAKQCVGTGYNQFTYIQGLFDHVQKKLGEHSQEVHERLSARNSELRTKIINKIRQNTDVSFGINQFKDILNGLQTGRREGLNADFIINAKSLLKLDDNTFVSEQFLNTSFPNIGRCIQGSQNIINPLVTSLPFPKKAINKLIKSPKLKLALSAGLTQWDWCFEIAMPPKGTDNIISAYVLAYEKNKDGELQDQTKIKAMWKWMFEIPSDKKELALNSYRKTVIDRTYSKTTEYLDLGRGSSNSMKLEDSFIHSKSITLTQICIPETEVIGRDILNVTGSGEIFSIRNRRKFTRCEQLTDVFADMWREQSVSTSSVLDTTSNLLPLRQSPGADQLDIYYLETPQNLNEQDYNESLSEILPPALDKSIDDFELKFKKIQDPYMSFQIEGFESRLNSAIKGYYYLVKNAFEKCYFAALKGYKKCTPLGTSSLLRRSKVDLRDVFYASDLFAKIPDIIYRPKFPYRKTDSKQVGLSDLMGEIIGPTHIFELAEVLYRSGKMEENAVSLVEQLLKSNQNEFQNSLMPYLMANYEFDEGLLVDTQLILKLEKLEKQFLQKR